ncbi:putative E3 ubiquitin-protein ligase RING1 [Iris pallida]|uniref:RING-type E3 ubiquitin transferase n=1 Tax=Iris pallida TaxID=29817 RepID=A0AAX6HMR5_IRIPA|nr:putative E3 ubiquitin-protein ligase RING1 [Iris pallida]
MSSSSGIGSFWCYRCSRFVRVSHHGNTGPISCPDCSGGFLEELSTPPRLAAAAAEHRRRRFPSALVSSSSSGPIVADEAHRRNRRGSSGDRSPFNPVIVLRGASEGMEPDRSNTSNNFELYYDDGAGSGLRPLPSTVSDFLMGSGFDRLLGQLAQIGTNGAGGVRACDHPPASKGAIESMPTISIDPSHIGMDSYCAVCKEKFELGTEAREMPCKHIYHHDCILPWLLLRNSCPVCRHELPTDAGRRNLEFENDDESMGLTIWRLPGGGFAVGRFAGGRRPGERELPMVYTEMDGGFNDGGAPRRILWSARGNQSRESVGFVRTLRNMFSFRCFGGSPSLSASSAGASTSRSVSTPSSRHSWRAPVLRRSRGSRRDGNSWALEDGSGTSISRW